MSTGVYLIVNECNGKVYVGSAAYSFDKRWDSHKSKLRCNIHYNKHLQAAWNKYGECNFTWHILEECPPEKCIEREQYWLDDYKSYERDNGYNLYPTACSPLGYKHTEETKEKCSERERVKYSNPIYREKHRIATTVANKRKPFDPEWCRRNREAQLKLVEDPEVLARKKKTMNENRVKNDTKRKYKMKLWRMQPGYNTSLQIARLKGRLKAKK